jgi:hypothetical protein
LQKKYLLNSLNSFMNKILLYLMTVLTGLIIAGGCSKNEPAESPRLSATPEQVTATANSSSYRITVTCNTAWTATSDAGWCTLSPAFAEGNGVITVSVAENTATVSRTATITVTAGVLTYTVTVNQAAATSDMPTLSVYPANIEAAANSASYSISLTGNTAWSASVEADWVTVDPVSGNGSVTVTVTALSVTPDNITGEEQRTARITFTAGQAVATVDVLQKLPEVNNYYKTGEVIKLHTHTEGKGIRVIILGDGFDRNDCMHDGFYYDMCNNLKKLFLTMPIIRDFTEYFDVWARVDISKDRGTRSCWDMPNDCPDNVYGSGHPPDLNWNKIDANASITAEGRKNSIIIMGNGMIGGAAYGDRGIYSAQEVNNAYWMIHEFAGHVIGYFPDLYPESFGDGNADDKIKEMIDKAHARGELCTLDWRNDPAEVFWKDFIGKPGYSRVGVYPTGHYSVKYGELFTCEPPRLSAMYDRNLYFTVMERYQLWRQIQMRAEIAIDPTMEAFMEYDVVNINREGSNEGNPLWGDRPEEWDVWFEMDLRVWGWDD